MWKAVETEARKTGVAKAKKGRSKRGSRKEMRGEGRKKQKKKQKKEKMIEVKRVVEEWKI